MGKVQLFEIRLSDSRVVYSPGEPLVGSVTVRLAGALQYRAIKVSCVGSCGVSNKMNDTAWTVEEQYFNTTLSLADKGILSSGEHTFPFRFLLPASAPTSFEGPFGKVVHQVKAVIETPRFSKDHKCHKVFYVLCPLNLNDIPDIEQFNTHSITKKFSYKLVKTGNLVLTATTDLKGYTVGQIIQLRTDIENKSGRDTSTIVASLIQKVAYKSRRWIYDLRTIAEVEGSAVKAWKHAEWKEQILVPALPQSILQGCSLIHIDYYIQRHLLPTNRVVAARPPASATTTRPSEDHGEIGRKDHTGTRCGLEKAVSPSHRPAGCPVLHPTCELQYTILPPTFAALLSKHLRCLMGNTAGIKEDGWPYTSIIPTSIWFLRCCFFGVLLLNSHGGIGCLDSSILFSSALP